eukprot:3907249-Rhodomonas_salina.2
MSGTDIGYVPTRSRSVRATASAPKRGYQPLYRPTRLLGDVRAEHSADQRGEVRYLPTAELGEVRY